MSEPWSAKKMGGYWYVVHRSKKKSRSKKIGPCNSTTHNYQGVALKEAARRNAIHEEAQAPKENSHAGEDQSTPE